MTDTTRGVGLCDICGELKGAGCHCVDASGLLGFLDTFRSASLPTAGNRPAGGPAADPAPGSAAGMDADGGGAAGVDSAGVDAAGVDAAGVGAGPVAPVPAPPAPERAVPASDPAPPAEQAPRPPSAAVAPVSPVAATWAPPPSAPSAPPAWGASPPAAPPAWGTAPPAWGTPPAWGSSTGAGWPSPMPSYPMANARSNRHVTVAIVLAVLVLAAATGLVLWRDDRTPTIPSLSSLLANVPAPGYAADPSGPFNGYMTPDQIHQFVQTSTLPSGINMYGTTWKNSDGTVIGEIAISVATVYQAEAVVAGISRAFTSLGSEFPVGIPGRAVGVAVPASAATRDVDEVDIAVARSRVAFMYIEAGADAVTTGESTLTATARSTASSLAVDRGAVGNVPFDPTDLYQAGQVVGYSALPLLVIGLVTFFVGRRRARRPSY